MIDDETVGGILPDCAGWTDLNTPIATHALRPVVHDLGLGTVRLWIGAPNTLQRATFEEDQRANTRTVSGGEPLDVKYGSAEGWDDLCV